MRILIVTQYWHPENGVPQRRWLWLADVLRKEGHEVLVVAPSPNYLRKVSWSEWLRRMKPRVRSMNESGIVGERIYRCLYVPASSSLTSRVVNQAVVALSSLWKIINPVGEIRKLQPDLIVGTVPALPTAVVARLAATIIRAPYILDIRDAWPELLDYSAAWNSSIGPASVREKVLSKGPLQAVVLITRWALDNAIRNAAGVIVTADRLRKHLIVKHQMDGANIETVRNVFPVNTAPTQERENSSKRNALNVLYAGTLGRAQGLENAIRAAEIAHNMGLDIHLRLVGAGAARATLEEAAETSPACISVESRRPSEEMSDLYLWADTALVHLADWKPLQMAIPSKTFELILSGVHITAVAEGETRDIVEALDAGVAVAPSDPEGLAKAWVGLVRDLREGFGAQNGQAWVLREQEETAPSKLISLIERVGGSN